MFNQPVTATPLPDHPVVKEVDIDRILIVEGNIIIQDEVDCTFLVYETPDGLINIAMTQEPSYEWIMGFKENLDNEVFSYSLDEGSDELFTMSVDQVVQNEIVNLNQGDRLDIFEEIKILLEKSGAELSDIKVR